MEYTVGMRWFTMSPSPFYSWSFNALAEALCPEYVTEADFKYFKSELGSTFCKYCGGDDGLGGTSHCNECHERYCD